MAKNALPPQNSPFLKQLATSDTRTRAEALENLRQYLRGHAAFADLELLKLWKGLFYSMWMSDRARNQQRLAADLAGLVEVLREENRLPFLDAFWKTMAREWGGIDVLRMDKFLFLVRQYLAVTFRDVLRREEAVEGHIMVLEDTPLNPTDARIPNGLRYHVLDIYVDELEKADTDKKLVEGALLARLLAPIQDVMKKSPTKSVRKRASETLDDARLKNWSGMELGQEDPEKAQASHNESDSHEGENDEDEWGGIVE